MPTGAAAGSSGQARWIDLLRVLPLISGTQCDFFSLNQIHKLLTLLIVSRNQLIPAMLISR
jgi:hypothetical protein